MGSEGPIRSAAGNSSMGHHGEEEESSTRELFQHSLTSAFPYTTDLIFVLQKLFIHLNNFSADLRLRQDIYLNDFCVLPRNQKAS